MPKKSLTRDQIKTIAEELEINQPIMSYRVVGDRVELRLLGGSTAVYEEAGAGDVAVDLSKMGIKQLRFLATKFMVPKRSKMSKMQLIEALSEHDQSAIATAIATYNI